MRTSNVYANISSEMKNIRKFGEIWRDRAVKSKATNIEADQIRKYNRRKNLHKLEKWMHLLLDVYRYIYV